MKSDTQKEIEDLLLWRDTECQDVLKQVCNEYGIHPDALADLVAWERTNQPKTRKRGREGAFTEIFSQAEYWR